MDTMGDASRPLVGVKFTPVGRSHTFLLPEFALDAPLARGEQVVVRTAHGQAVGEVVSQAPEVAERRRATAAGNGAVLRRATREDIITRLTQVHREQDAHQVCLLKIKERGLQMKLTKVEQHFDGSRLIFYFTADGRVDFRELVRDLAAEFRTRIEMRQIGVRDEARLLSGYGSCGRPLCCTTWLQSFDPVSIRMAKQQNLSLNPSKLSGLCGRLKCCLRYELPNAKGDQYAGCAHESSCAGGACTGGGCSGDGAGCGAGCGSCGS